MNEEQGIEIVLESDVDKVNKTLDKAIEKLKELGETTTKISSKITKNGIASSITTTKKELDKVTQSMYKLNESGDLTKVFNSVKTLNKVLSDTKKISNQNPLSNMQENMIESTALGALSKTKDAAKKIEKCFKDAAEASREIDSSISDTTVAKLQKLGEEVTKITTKLTKNGMIATINTTKKELDKITNSVYKLDEKGNFKKISESVKELNTNLKQTKVLSNDINNVISDKSNISSKISSIANTSSNFTFNTSKLKEYLEVMKDVVDEGIDYSEQLNLFNVVFKNFEKDGEIAYSKLGLAATKYQNKLNEAFGTSKKSTMYTQAIFQSMAESLGADMDTAYKMSESMTNMTYDLASMFNQSEAKVAEAIRSGVYAGQTRTLKNYGIDITQANLSKFSKDLGIETSVTKMSQAEKQMLRYYAVLKQTSNAQGDFANTIESPANQLKILSQQATEVKIAFSRLFTGLYAEILPYVNGIVMAIKSVVNAIADMLNLNLKDYNKGLKPMEDYADGVDEIGDGFEEAAKKAKKANLQILGFDQINNLSTPTDSDTSTGLGNSEAYDKITAALEGYDSLMADTRMKALDIRDAIMEWLGFEMQIDDVTDQVSFKFKRITGGTVLGALGVGGVIFKGVSGIFGFAKKLGLLKFPGVEGLGTKLLQNLPKVAELDPLVLIITALVATFVRAYKTSEEFRTKVNELGIALKNLFTTIAGTIIGISSKIVEEISPYWEDIKKVLSGPIEIAYSIIKGKLTDIIDKLTIGANVITALLKGDIKGAFEEVIKLPQKWSENIKTTLSEIGKALEGVPESFKRILDGLVEKVVGFIQRFKEKIENFDAKKTFEKIVTKAKSIDWFALGSEVATNIVTGIFELGKSVGEFGIKMHTALSDASKKVYDELVDLGKTILKKILKGMIDFSPLPDFAKDFVKNLGKEIDKAISKNPIKIVPGIGGGLGAITSLFKENGGVYSNGSWTNIPQYASGGLPSHGTLFTAGENGAEIVGNIGGRTEVLNQSQIASAIYSAVVNAMSQSNQGIEVYVHSDEGVIVDKINRKTRQTGVSQIYIP